MTASSPLSDFGGKLRQARERRGISLRQIATSTKISVGVLEALERNDVSKLPGGIFSRAFVRSYALEVGLDPEEVVREFLAGMPPEIPVVGPYAPPSRVDAEETVFESQQRMAGVALKLILVSVPIAVALLYFSLGPGGRSPAPSVSTPASPAANRTRDAGQVRAGPAAEPATVPQSGALLAAADVQPPAPAPAEPTSAPAWDDLVLEVAPIGPCWVSLTVDDELILSRVIGTGERIVRRVRQDAVLQVGDAGAFAFAINGRPGRPLGARGEVKSLHITRENVDAWLR
jgi:cytoskeletal protein RodZ